MCLGYVIGLQLARAYIESAPQDAGHGPIYVAAGICVLVSKVGLVVGFVSGLLLWARYLRKRRTSHSETG